MRKRHTPEDIKQAEFLAEHVTVYPSVEEAEAAPIQFLMHEGPGASSASPREELPVKFVSVGRAHSDPEVLKHELGHIKLGHRGYADLPWEEIIQREVEANLYAVKRWGWSPYLTAGIAELLASIDGQDNRINVLVRASKRVGLKLDARSHPIDVVAAMMSADDDYFQSKGREIKSRFEVD